MRLRYPRLVGALALLWVPIMRKGLLDWPSDAVWAGCTAAWIACGVLLVRGRRVREAAAGLCLLALYLAWVPAGQLVDALALFAWVGLILVVSDGRPHERALLVRVLVTTVYAFAALAKLNPSWLSGDQIVGVVVSRGRLDALLPLLRSDWGVALAVVVLAAEGWMAIGLWLPRLRRPTMALGLVLHPSLVLFATYGSLEDVAFITVLNAMLVIGYFAFLEPIQPPAVDDVAVAAAGRSSG